MHTSSSLHNNRLKERIILATILLLFAIIYCLISLVNHYEFRTYALDLGLYNHALYSVAHFKTGHIMLDFTVTGMNFIGDHFSPIFYLYIPFYYLFGSYTLLLIQIASVLFGGLGIYKYCKFKFPEGYIPLFITFQFFGIWGIYSALAFDFHNNVVGAMFLPWLFYYYEKENKKLFFLFFALVLMSKENMALWLAFIMLGLMLKKGVRNYKAYLRFEIPVFAFCLFYLVMVTDFLMPYLQHSTNNYQFFHYARVLGKNLPEIFSSIIHHPINTFSLLFSNSFTDPTISDIKTELHFMMLASGGLAMIYRPYYLIMLLPLYAQKLMTDYTEMWGIDYQYSIEFAPLLSLALADAIFSIKPKTIRYFIAGIYTLYTHYSTFHSMGYRVDPFYNPDNTKYYTAQHYNSGLNLPAIYGAFHLIPEEVTLSVNTTIAPHLANRDKIYAFPNVLDAGYIVLFDNVRSTYPMGEKEYNKLVNRYRDSTAFSTIYDENHLLILKRK